MGALVLTPTRALHVASDAEALPEVAILGPLYRFGFVPRAGQVLMVAGQPGSLKSMFGQWYADELGLRTLYFCADSDPHTAVTRLAAKRTGYTSDEVARALETGAAGFFVDALAGSNLQFCFDSGPTLDDVALEVYAYVELWDAYPEVIIIDNLLNVEAEVGEEFAGMRMVSKEIHRLARETGAAVMILHHMRECDDASNPQPRAHLQGKVSQLPERILSVAYDADEGAFKMAPVKNRGGRQDPSGKQFFRLRADPARATFYSWA